MKLRLTIRIGFGRPSPFETDKPAITIGRDPHCDVSLAGDVAQVSWQHARIEMFPGGAFVSDLESSNGTFVNNERVTGQIEIHESDEMRLGVSGPTLRVQELHCDPVPALATDTEPLLREADARSEDARERDHEPSTRHVVMDLMRKIRRLWFIVAVLLLAAIGIGTTIWGVSGHVDRETIRNDQQETEIAWLNEQQEAERVKIANLERQIQAVNDRVLDRISRLREKTEQELRAIEKRSAQEFEETQKRFRELDSRVPPLPELVFRRTVCSSALVRTNRGRGSGALIDKDRKLVITAYHVIDRVESIRIVFPKFLSGKLLSSEDDYTASDEILARIWASDSKLDLAILELSRVPAHVLELPLALGPPALGATVHTVGGQPKSSVGFWVYSQGSVRELAQEKYQFSSGQAINARVIRTQNPINPGDSGGALVDDRCQLVGICSAGTPGVELVRTFIDVREVHDLLKRRP